MRSIYRGGVSALAALPLPEICFAALRKLSTLPQGEGGALDRPRDPLQAFRQPRRVLGEADADVGIRRRVARRTERRARGDADAGSQQQIFRKGEAVGHAVDLQEPVERAFGPHPADAVLAVDEILHHVAALAATL